LNISNELYELTRYVYQDQRGLPSTLHANDIEQLLTQAFEDISENNLTTFIKQHMLILFSEYNTKHMPINNFINIQNEMNKMFISIKYSLLEKLNYFKFNKIISTSNLASTTSTDYFFDRIHNDYVILKYLN
jgi:hypothetical protein